MSCEAEITDWFASQARLDARSFPIGIGDDMAQIALSSFAPAGDGSILITTDMLLDGTHFRLDSGDSLEDVGYKAMAVNLSDCAAMATMPVCAVCSVGIPRSFGASELKQLHAGIKRAADLFDCPLVGGDITSWNNPLAINITMLSRPVGTAPVRRSTAVAGDFICVTGTLGGSLAGRHLRFVPRVREAIKLASLVTLHSLMDISDGLSTDLNHICRLSGVGAMIDAAFIPISEEAKKSSDPLASALNDGEDFELLFTLSPTQYDYLKTAWRDPLAITRIGRITQARKVVLRNSLGQTSTLVPRGYDHVSH